MTQEQYAEGYGRGFGLTVRFLVSCGVEAGAAEEWAQAGWTRGWECRGQLRDPKRLQTWVNTIALNLFRTDHRRWETGQLLSEIPVPPQASPRTIDLRRIIEKCNPPEREMLRKHYLAGYTSKELAAQEGCQASTVRVRLLRLRRRLQTLMGGKRVRGQRESTVAIVFGHDQWRH